MQLTRRALLLAAGGVAVAGCRPNGRTTAAPRAADEAAVERALASERALLAGYDAAIARRDAVTALPLARARARHAAHVAALESTSSTRTPAQTASTAPSVPALDADLRAALRRSVPALQSAAISATTGEVAALLASIAAEHATDVAAGAAR